MSEEHSDAVDQLKQEHAQAQNTLTNTYED